MPTVLDHVLFVLTALVSPLVDWLWLYPLLVRASAAGVRGARPRAYGVYLVTAWGLTAAVLGHWAARSRPWQALGLGLAAPWRTAVGVALAAAYVWLGLAQREILLAKPDRLQRVFQKMSSAEALIPHASGECRGFAAVSVTAGICEEILFRGFVLWYVAAWTGPVAAVVVSSILFGFGHLYLGLRHFYRTTLGGLFFALVVLASGALWPAILIHAFADLVSGDLGYHALGGREREESGPDLAAAAS